MLDTQVITQEEWKRDNAILFEQLGSRDPMQVKKAEDTINAFTRTTMKEDGVYRRVIPMIPIPNEELDRSVATSKPVKVIDREPDNPGSITIPFAALPSSLYMQAERYEVRFVRMATPRYTKDVSELRTWIMDVRQVLSDNSIKDLLAEEDKKFFAACDYATVGPDIVVANSGVVQHQVFDGDINRDSLFDMKKVLPSTPSSLETHTIVVNHITINDVCKFTYEEMGGDVSGEIMKKGWTIEEFMGIRWIITIKKALVPTKSFRLFADPSFIGKSFSLEPVTLHVKRDAYFVEFFAYEEIGGAIGWTSGIGRVDHQ
jgi:hypothetical protein